MFLIMVPSISNIAALFTELDSTKYTDFFQRKIYESINILSIQYIDLLQIGVKNRKYWIIK